MPDDRPLRSIDVRADRGADRDDVAVMCRRTRDRGGGRAGSAGGGGGAIDVHQDRCASGSLRIRIAAHQDRCALDRCARA
jgi:hypothetical protein